MKNSSCHIRLVNKLDELLRIYEELERFAHEVELPDSVKYALFLVSEELFTNVVRYGYGEEAQGEIQLELTLDGDDLLLEIRDRGKCFDVSADTAGPAGAKPVAEMEVGGLGLFLVHQFSRSVSYVREGDMNTVRLVLSCKGNAGDGEMEQPAI